MTHSQGFSMNTIVQWDPEQITTEIGGEVVAMSTRKGVYIGLDAAASQIWRRLEKPQSIRELCGQLSLEFQGDAETISRDVIELLVGLSDAGMVTASGRT